MGEKKKIQNKGKKNASMENGAEREKSSPILIVEGKTVNDLSKRDNYFLKEHTGTRPGCWPRKPYFCRAISFC